MTPEEVYNYVSDTNRANGFISRHYEFESIIAQDGFWSVCYARNVIGGRFLLGEAAIAQNPQFAYWYAVSVRGRFPLGEATIARDPKLSWLYAKDVIGNRFFAAEPTIMNSGYAEGYCTQFGIEIKREAVNWQKVGF